MQHRLHSFRFMIHNSKHTHHCKNSHSFDDDDGSARQCPSMCPSCDWSLVARDRTTRATDCTEQWPSWAGLGRCSLVVSISQRSGVRYLWKFIVKYYVFACELCVDSCQKTVQTTGSCPLIVVSSLERFIYVLGVSCCCLSRSAVYVT